jgi:hypothetical protein
MDESGISIVSNLVPKVISPKGKKIVCKVTSGERRHTVTVVCYMSLTDIFILLKETDESRATHRCPRRNFANDF